MEKGPYLLRKASVLLLVATLCLSVVAVAETDKRAVDETECQGVWLGHQSDDPQIAGAEVWLGYDDGGAEYGIGTSSPMPMTIGILFDETDLAPYDGWTLDAFKWYEIYFEPELYPTHTVNYMIGTGNATHCDTILINETETTINESGFKEFTLDGPYTINADQAIWCMVQISDAGPYPDDNPFGYDANAASYVAGKSSMVDTGTDPDLSWSDFGLNLEGAWVLNVHVFKDEPAFNITFAGGIGVTATIENIGEADATNVEALIEATGGLILLGGSKTVAVGDIAVGASADAKSLLIGIGKPVIECTVTCDEGITANATYEPKFLLLFFLL
jgi:hypothetical protein